MTVAGVPARFRAALEAALTRPLFLEPVAFSSLRAMALFRPRAESSTPPEPFTRSGDVAVVSVSGPLAQRAWSCCGFEGDGYDSIQARVTAALEDPDTRAVVLRVDSPGGEVAGCFEAVRGIRAAKVRAKKPLVAYADECACSAAYALACACDEVVLPDTGAVGSVGVIRAVTSYAEKLASEGVAVALFTSGSAKSDGHPAVALSDEARDRLQAEVDQLARVFAAEVSVARPLDVESVLRLDARVFLGATAVEARLADHVGSFAFALSRARALASRSTLTGAVGATGKGMSLYSALGVDTEEDAVLAVQSLTKFRAQVRAATGADTDDAALGTLAAWKRDAEAVSELRAQLAAEKLAAEKRERAEILEAAVASLRLTPAERDADGQPGAFTTGLSNSALRAFAARPVTVANSPRQPVQATPTGASLTAEQRAFATALGLDFDAYAQALARG